MLGNMLASVTPRWLARCVPSSAHAAVVTQTIQQVRWGSTSKKLGAKRGTNVSIDKVPSMKDDNVSIEEYAQTMDTTIPPEKQAHVDKLKKQIRGGSSKSLHSLYREVPTPEEMDQLTIPGNFVPKIAINAREIIDFALSHIPEKGGPRRTKHKKRMALKWKNKEAEDARRKKEKQAARLRKHQILKKGRDLVRAMKKEARKLYWPDGTPRPQPKSVGVQKKLTSSL
jgi:hypothetical protein